MRRHIHETIRFWLLALAALLIGPARGEGLPYALGIETKINYDWMGHQYRIGEDDTLDLYDEKSLAAIFTYGDAFAGGIWAENRATLSDRSLQNILTAGWSSDVAGETRWSVQNRLDFKDYRWKGEDLFGSSYAQDDLDVKGSWPLGSSLRLVAGQSLSYVDYQKTTSYFRDSWLNRTTARLEWEPGLMSDMAVGYSLGLKSVPDSSGMNYRTHSLTSSFDGLIGWLMRVHLDGLVEKRLMERQEGQPDHLDLTVNMEIEYDLGIRTSLVIGADAEQLAYDRPDEVCYDYWTATGKAGVSHDLTDEANITLQPVFRRSEAKGTTFGEIYREIGVELDVDYYGTGWLWGHASLEIGSRDYAESEEETFYSNFDYIHPTLFLNVRLNDKIRLDVMIDHEPEWHKQKEDDFTSSLVSCSLGYSFR